jgi:hypothetical protein
VDDAEARAQGIRCTVRLWLAWTTSDAWREREIDASAFSNSEEKEHAMKSTDSTVVAVLLMLKRQDD